MHLLPCAASPFAFVKVGDVNATSWLRFRRVDGESKPVRTRNVVPMRVQTGD